MSRKTHFDIVLEFWIWVSKLKWEILGFREWRKMREAFKWERVIWRLRWCWAGETDGQFGHRRWSQLRVHKNDKTFHIKSWFSYFPLLGFENAIMLGWEGQSTTFPKLFPKSNYYTHSAWIYLLSQIVLKQSTFVVEIIVGLFRNFSQVPSRLCMQFMYLS